MEMTSSGDISVHSYSQSFQKVVNGTSIQKIAYVINKWKTGIEKNRTGLYEKKAPMRTKREYLVLRKSLSIYKNNLSSDLTKECHFHVVIFLLA